MFVLTTIAAMLMSAGTFCLLWWFPFPIQGSPHSRTPHKLFRVDFVLGTIGTVSYVAQLVRLAIVGVEIPSHTSENIVVLMYAVMMLAVILFGICTVNFVRAAISARKS
jgi:hypothetical protein